MKKTESVANISNTYSSYSSYSSYNREKMNNKAKEKQKKIDMLFELENEKLRKFYKIVDKHNNDIKKFKEKWDLSNWYAPMMMY